MGENFREIERKLRKRNERLVKIVEKNQKISPGQQNFSQIHV